MGMQPPLPPGLKSILNQPKTGIIIPTMGQRALMLDECIAAVKQAGNVYLVVVSPIEPKLLNLDFSDQLISFVQDEKSGLAAAINAGIRSLPPDVEFCTWIGDDDLLEQDSIEASEALFDSNPDAVMVFGGCKYINADGQTIGINKSGQWAVPLLRFGPCLIPQPGSLFRRQAFEQVGGLDSTFGWAFDFDLFIRLSKIGKLVHTKKILASFRWHCDSLTVGQRRNSVGEASLVRRSHLHKWLVHVSHLWELPVKFFTLHAGEIVNRRAIKVDKNRIKVL